MTEELTAEWSIAELAASAHISTRTLRHYDAIGLLAPSRVAASGHRFYDEAAVLRLQQVLAYRELGVALADIAATLDSGLEPHAILVRLEQELEQRLERQQRQLASIRRALAAHDTTEALMPDQLLDGFDHADHREEVEERWGTEAYAGADRWWRGMRQDERDAWRQQSAALIADWVAAAQQGEAPDGEVAQRLAERQSRWLASIPGTPGAGTGEADLDYLLGLGDMYVADDRFAANYGGAQGASFVRDALRAFVAGRG